MRCWRAAPICLAAVGSPAPEPSRMTNPHRERRGSTFAWPGEHPGRPARSNSQSTHGNWHTFGLAPCVPPFPWSAVTGLHELDPPQFVMLEQACRQRDRCDALAPDAAAGHPGALRHERNAALTMTRLLAALRRPNEAGREPQAPQIRGCPSAVCRYVGFGTRQVAPRPQAETGGLPLRHCGPCRR